MVKEKEYNQGQNADLIIQFYPSLLSQIPYLSHPNTLKNTRQRFRQVKMLGRSRFKQQRSSHSFWSLSMRFLGSGKSGEREECCGCGYIEGVHILGSQSWRTWNMRQWIKVMTRLDSFCWALRSGGFLAGCLFRMVRYEQPGSRSVWHLPQCTAVFLLLNLERVYTHACLFS